MFKILRHKAPRPTGNHRDDERQADISHGPFVNRLARDPANLDKFTFTLPTPGHYEPKPRRLNSATAFAHRVG